MKKYLCLILVAVMFCGTFAGCSKKSKANIEMSYFDEVCGENGEYNTSLFYRNDLNTIVADPQVIQITDKNSEDYGKFYLYGTGNSKTFFSWRSDDMINWELHSDALIPDANAFGTNEYWAPEVIWDSATGKYYMFYSATSKTTGGCMLSVAVSDSPAGPFVQCTTKNAPNGPYYDHDKILSVIKEKYPQLFGSQSLMRIIDPSPYVDTVSGKKYLLFSGFINPQCVFGMEMGDTWLDAKYDTVTLLTVPGYTTTDRTTECNYEKNNLINEGPQMYYAEGKYYLTFSINDFDKRDYSVAQAVGDSPLGTFTKPEQEDGGVLLSIDNSSWDNISGPGHHSFVQVNGQLYIAYHAHTDKSLGGNRRGYAVDTVKLVKNTKGENVLYANGPTCSIQPKLEFASDYKNIASDAKVTATNQKDGTSTDYLTDGLLSLYSFNNYVKEFDAKTGKTTITMTFDDYRQIHALMIYNSKDFDTAFGRSYDAEKLKGIDRIEFDFKDSNGVTGSSYIDNLAFDWDFYKMPYTDAMRPGGSAIAEFEELGIKEIRITIDQPVCEDHTNDKDACGMSISEIVVLGK